MAGTWYYAEGTTRHGPVAASEIYRLILDSRLLPESLVWQDGMADWQRADAHFDFPAPDAGKAPPPLPAGSGQGARPALPRTGAGDRGGEQGRGTTGPDGLYIHAPSRGFGEAITVCFQKYVGFSGRASRSEYWFFVLFLFLLGMATALVDMIVFGATDMTDFSPLNTLATLGTILPSLAVTWRRLHDTDRSGWWWGGFFIVALIGGVIVAMGFATGVSAAAFVVLGLYVLAVIGYLIMLIAFTCTQGDPGPNRFG